MHKLKHSATAAVVALTLFFVAGALAEPPDHAKAHGWRKQHDLSYVGFTGRRWERDYGVLDGNCNREEIDSALGAVVGAIGSQVGDGSGRTVATIVGSVIGALTGREIGRVPDDADRACIGHALELAKAGEQVRWVNDSTGVAYVIAPLAIDRAGSCRGYKLTMARAGKARTSDGKACRANDGTWKGA